MLSMLFLPLADFKTIEAPQAVGPIGVFLIQDDALFLALVAGGLAATFLFLRLWNRPTSLHAGRSPDETWVLVDGSNVMHWQDGQPQLLPVQRVIEELTALGYVPGVVFDANAGWKLVGRYLHDGDFARLLNLEPRQVLVVAKGTRADPFLLQTARDFGARIVTNDRCRDFAEAHPEVLEQGFLIRGGMREGKLLLKGLEALRVGATRRPPT
jgi:Zc3h12a-like Ribonuclease NYN domain